MSAVRLATRGSALALVQAEIVSVAIGGAEVVQVRNEEPGVDDKERWVAGVERALLAGKADIGVHSAKDLPGELPEGLAIIGVPEREEPSDALIGEASSLDDLAEGATVGTASLRRRSQLLAARPDLEITDLHGNVDTRLAKLAAGEYDAIVLASAGVRRLGREREISFRFEIDDLVPAPGQGCLAIEALSDHDGPGVAEAAEITDRNALIELTAERAAVRALAASCETPVGICARVEGDELVIRGYAGLADGGAWVRDRISGDAGQPVALGEALVERMVAAGARVILDQAELEAAKTG